MGEYLMRIFPEKVSIEGQKGECVVPKFFTFMSTDPEGANQYFHCLMYYEQFTKFDVLHDDDPNIEEVTRRLEAKKKKGKMPSHINTGSLGQLSRKKTRKSKELSSEVAETLVGR